MMSNKRLLVVDDEPDFGEFVRQVAQLLDYEVMVATNSRAFQQGYIDFQPNLIILDMVMPDMDGNEVLLWLLRQGYDAGLIITTGYSPDYAQEAKTLAEFNGLKKVSTLTKPVRSIELRSVLTRDEPLGPDHRPAAV